MPEIRKYKGRLIKHTKRIVTDTGKVIIRMMIDHGKGVRGHRIDTSIEDYEKHVVKVFIKK